MSIRSNCTDTCTFSIQANIDLVARLDSLASVEELLPIILGERRVRYYLIFVLIFAVEFLLTKKEHTSTSNAIRQLRRKQSFRRPSEPRHAHGLQQQQHAWRWELFHITAAVPS